MPLKSSVREIFGSSTDLSSESVRGHERVRDDPKKGRRLCGDRRAATVASLNVLKRVPPIGSKLYQVRMRQIFLVDFG